MRLTGFPVSDHLALGPCLSSMALDTSSDFGKPCPYSHSSPGPSIPVRSATESRISNPASSIPHVSRCQVRVPPKPSIQPPGLSTRKHSAAHASHQAW